MTPEERRELGRIIAKALQHYLTQLINTIDLHTAANHLFGARIISDNHFDMATKETTVESAKNRAGKLIVTIISKLEANPHMFRDVCIAFEQAGAESIINEVKGKIELRLLSAPCLKFFIIAEVQRKSKEIVSPSQGKINVYRVPS